MGHYDFYPDLEIARGIEERVILHMSKVNPDMKFHGFSGTKGYDAHFTVDEQYFKLEIKSDYHTVDTGNIVIEYESRGKSSGITTTQANLIAYAVITTRGLDIYLIPTIRIKQMISDEEYERKTIGGDYGSSTKMYLFKLEKVAKYAKKLEENLGN